MNATNAQTDDTHSATERRIGARYSVRELGKSQWIATDSLAVAIVAKRDARGRAGLDCVIIDNRTGEEVTL